MSLSAIPTAEAMARMNVMSTATGDRFSVFDWSEVPWVCDLGIAWIKGGLSSSLWSHSHIGEADTGKDSDIRVR